MYSEEVIGNMLKFELAVQPQLLKEPKTQNYTRQYQLDLGSGIPYGLVFLTYKIKQVPLQNS